MTPEQLEALLGGREPDVEVEAKDAASKAQSRTQLLEKVLASVKQKSDSENSGVEIYAEKLATGARDESWRVPIGDSGLLDFFVAAFGKAGASTSLKIHTLRLIGNSCADTDANRERVVKAEAIPVIAGLLTELDLLPFVTAVLYNVMVDYAPAQLQASNAKLSSRLVDLLSGAQPDTFAAQMNTICKILNLLASQEPENDNANPKTPSVLLNLAASPDALEDLEDFVPVVSVAQEYLTLPNPQREFISSGCMPTFLSVFEKLNHETLEPEQLEDSELGNQVTILRKVLVNSVADLTDNPAFSAAHPIGSPIFTLLRSWLDSPNPALQSAACLSLGNLSRSDESSLAFVGVHDMHTPLIKILSASDTSNSLLVHSTLSFLKNLAIPAQNKRVLGPPLLSPDVLPRLWTRDALPQVLLAAASLTRLLLVGTPQNVEILCTPLPPAPAPESDEAGSPSPKTQLHALIELFRRTDDPAKMEAARAVLTCLRSLPPNAPFYEIHPDITGPISYLLTQSRFPSLRSEVFFVLGLASRSPESLPVIANILSAPETFGVFKEAITGPSEAVEAAVGPADEAALQVPGAELINASEQQAKPQHDPRTARADRENSLIVVAALVKGFETGALEDEGKKAEFEGLLQEGGVAMGNAEKD